ncbi:MAG: hypothetical protein RMJ87_12925 [Cytophagales bacterium]|nr:hypothetical protein [Bernardetiaceae bacterium]MDW8205925.1 hypothetical protein [Cytophagales bacterium]
MLLDLAFMGVLFLLSIPLTCGYFAYTRGRSFWLWFALGLLLPGIAHLILVCLPDSSNPLEKELESIRIQNSLLGTKPRSYAEKRFHRLIKDKKHTIRFSGAPATQSDVVTAQIWVNNQNLLAQLVKHEKLLKYYRFEPLPIELVMPPSNHLLGEPVAPYQNRFKRSAIFVHRNSEGVATAQIRVKIEPHPEYVIWYDFVLEHMGVERPLRKIRALVFNRLQYIEALDHLADLEIRA